MIPIVSQSLISTLGSESLIILFVLIGATAVGFLIGFFTYRLKKARAKDENKQSFLTVNQTQDLETTQKTDVFPKQLDNAEDASTGKDEKSKAIDEKSVQAVSTEITADIDTQSYSESDDDFQDTLEFQDVQATQTEDIVDEAAETEKLIWKVEEVSSLYVAQDDAIILKRSMLNKLKFANDDIKYYYNKIKNELMSYKVVKSRMSNVSENFRKKRELLAKITLAGDNLKVFLALDLNDYPQNIYHQKNMSKMDLYADVPFMVKVKTKLATRKACFLVSEVMRNFGLEKNPKYVEQDYRLELVPKENEVLSKSRSVITMREGELEKKIRKYKKQSGVDADTDVAEIIADVIANVKTDNVATDTDLTARDK